MNKDKNVFRGSASPEYVAGMQQLRRSNAAGKHADKRDKRARTRSAAKARAVKDW